MVAIYLNEKSATFFIKKLIKQHRKNEVSKMIENNDAKGIMRYVREHRNEWVRLLRTEKIIY